MPFFSAPEARLACNQPGVKLTGGLLSSTAANMGAAAGIALPESSAILGDIVIQTVTTAETIAVSGKDRGGATITAVEVINAATGNPVSATALASGTYYIPADRGANLYQSLIFTKSAAVNAGAVSCWVPTDFNANVGA